MGWISVDERLPDCSRERDSFGVQVIIYPPWKEEGISEVNCCFYGMRYECNGKPQFYMYGRVIDGVTHWQPLPAPPRSERSAGE